MAFERLLGQLPYIPPNEQRPDFIAKLGKWFKSPEQLERALHRFDDLFSPEGFKLVCDTHAEIFASTLAKAKLQGRGNEEDSLFPDTLTLIFETKGNCKRYFNEGAFNLLLSMVRRRYNSMLPQSRSKSTYKPNEFEQTLFG